MMECYCGVTCQCCW